MGSSNNEKGKKKGNQNKTKQQTEIHVRPLTFCRIELISTDS